MPCALQPSSSQGDGHPDPTWTLRVKLSTTFKTTSHFCSLSCLRSLSQACQTCSKGGFLLTRHLAKTTLPCDKHAICSKTHIWAAAHAMPHARSCCATAAVLSSAAPEVPGWHLRCQWQLQGVCPSALSVLCIQGHEEICKVGQQSWCG